MKEELFNDLVESIEEAGEWLREERDLPADQVQFAGEPDPRAIRQREGLSQEAFADALGISIRTLQNWEQGRRKPTGPAVRLLALYKKHPQLVCEPA